MGNVEGKCKSKIILISIIPKHGTLAFPPGTVPKLQRVAYNPMRGNRCLTPYGRTAQNGFSSRTPAPFQRTSNFIVYRNFFLRKALSLYI